MTGSSRSATGACFSPLGRLTFALRLREGSGKPTATTPRSFLDGALKPVDNRRSAGLPCRAYRLSFGVILHKGKRQALPTAAPVRKAGAFPCIGLLWPPAIETTPAADTRSTRQQGLAICLSGIHRTAHARNIGNGPLHCPFDTQITSGWR